MVKALVKDLRGGFVAVILVAGLLGCAPERGDLVESLRPNDTWQVLEHGGIALEIPPDFVAGIPGLQLPELQASLAEMGFGDRTDWLAQKAEEIELLAFQNSGDQLNTINVVRGGRSPEETLGAYLEEQRTKLEAAGLQITEQTVQDAGKMGVLTLTDGTQEQFIYVYPTAEDFLIVTYSGGSGQFDPSVIERSRRSIEILPESE